MEAKAVVSLKGAKSQLLQASLHQRKGVGESHTWAEKLESRRGWDEDTEDT